jgi:hypothetical protein
MRPQIEMLKTALLALCERALAELYRTGDRGVP